MEKRNLWVIPTVVFGFALLMTSCQQNEPTTAASAEVISTTAVDEAQAAAVSNEVVASADQFTPSFTSASSKVKSEVSDVSSESVTITVDRPDATTFPKVVTVDYGTTGFTGKRGNVLKGKMIITVSNKMNVPGATRTITFDNFSVNGNSIKGAKVITCNNDSSWTVVANDSIIKTDGTVITWNSERTRTRLSDNQTPQIPWDDTYAITGSSNGTNAKGIAYTMTIDSTNPLIIEGAFPFFTKGQVTITTEAKTVLVDYGNGTKDALATATCDGKTKTINLRK